jgi:hypothetical protein
MCRMYVVRTQKGPPVMLAGCRASDWRVFFASGAIGQDGGGVFSCWPPARRPATRANARSQVRQYNGFRCRLLFWRPRSSCVRIPRACRRRFTSRTSCLAANACSRAPASPTQLPTITHIGWEGWRASVPDQIFLSPHPINTIGPDRRLASMIPLRWRPDQCQSQSV